MQDKRLFLLDAMALVYRAYYALIRSPRVTSTGKNTNAQFGVTNTIVDLLQKENPTHMAVVWDTQAPTERHDTFSDYKANRQAAPEDFAEAIPDIKRIIKGFNIPCIGIDGYEADDVIGTLAWQASDKGYQVYMVTPDKDYGQLVRDNVYIYKPGYRGGTFEIIGQKEVCEKWDIENVSQVIDILGLMGDAVDNIPGITGIGEKTAIKLLNEYGTLENVLEHAEDIKGAMGEKIKAGKEQAILSKMLATIITNVPVTFDEKQFEVEKWNYDALNTVFRDLEFKTLGQRILGEHHYLAKQSAIQQDLFGQQSLSPRKETAEIQLNSDKEIKNIENTPHQYNLVTDDTLDTFINSAMQQQEISIDTETTGIDATQAEIVGISMSWEVGTGYYIPFPEDQYEASQKLEKLRALLTRKDVLWIGQNLKYDLIIFKNYGLELTAPHFDTMIAHYSISPSGKQGMDILSKIFLDYEPLPITRLIGKKGKGQLSMRDVDINIVKEYAAEDADITLQLKKVLSPLLKEEGVFDLFSQVENPLVPVLADMESEGINLDKKFLNHYAEQLGTEIKQAEKEVYQKAGVTFNLASPKQLGEVLFDKLKLDDHAKKTKTGQYATGEEILKKLKSKHSIIDDILTYRELAKLKSTYADALPQLINPKTGRIHTNFAQSVVVTGRLSSNNPNLQNIPIRTERGKEIRKAFIPRSSEYVLFSADYSQIELRIMAAISGDEEMIHAFLNNKDIHIATAAKVYKVSEDVVTPTMRRNAKAVNFGLIYGQSAFGLSESLNISRSEAKEIIDNYFIEYASVKSYMDNVINQAKSDGYVSTLMGRRITLDNINSSNNTIRSFAERVAINAPIQGSAADMIKLAMIDISKAIKEKKLKSSMLLQVHDELVFDIHKDELDTMQELVKNKMENALKLPHNVPVIVECGTGANWLDAH